MSARHFSLLSELTKQSAEAWPSRRPRTAAPTEAFLRYNAASRALISDVEKLSPRGIEVVRQPAPHGIDVLFRYCHIASLLAAEEEINPDELAEALRQNESFDPLKTLLSSPLKVVRRAEFTLGLVPISYPVDQHKLGYWQYKDGAVSVPAMNWVMAESRYDAASQGHEVEKGSCMAAYIMRSLFDSVVTICATDENLFQRSLAEVNQKQATSVII